VDGLTEHGGKLDINLLQADPCRFLEKCIKEYVRTSPLNHLITFNNAPIFDEPVVVFANGDNSAFQKLKTIVGEFHLTPREAIVKHIKAKGWRFGVKNYIENISVVSWALPIPYQTRLSERKTTYGGSTRYNHTRWRGGIFTESLIGYVCSLLEIMGYNAVAPSRSRFFEMKEMSGGWRVANWSERHIAYTCGLGTVGLNGLMITPKGCAVYLGSMVCDIALTPTAVSYTSHVANCLFYHDASCRRCMERCLAGAISEEGRNNIRCRENLVKKQSTKLKSLGLDKALIGLAPSCGLCSTKVPCETRIPPLASDETA